MERGTPNTLTSNVLLRETAESDLPIFFEQQLDPEANQMAAFTAKDPTDRGTFTAHWAKILSDEAITKMTVVVDGQVAGHVSRFEQFGQPEVSYWLGKSYWGKGLATRALSEFLDRLETRPVYARAAKDNIASLRVLAKCGFAIIGEDKGFSNARGMEIEEFVLELGADESKDSLASTSIKP